MSENAAFMMPSVKLVNSMMMDWIYHSCPARSGQEGEMCLASLQSCKSRRERLLAPEYFVNGAVTDRYDVNVSIRTTLNVRGDAKVSPKKQCFAFSNIKLG